MADREVIDELVVEVGQDTTDFDEGTKRIIEALEQIRDAVSETEGDIRESNRRSTNSFTSLEKSALRFFAAITAGRGIKGFTGHVLQTGASLSRMSENLGESADTLSRWGSAAKQSGGSMEAFLGTTQGISSALAEIAISGESWLTPYLQWFGISAADPITGKAKKASDFLLELRDRLAAMPDRTMAWNLGRMMQIDEGTLNLMLRSREEFDAIMKSQKTFSDADAKAAREAQERWDKAINSLESVGRELVISLVGPLEKIADVTIEIVELFKNLDEITDGWSSKVIAAAAALGGLGMAGKLLGGGRPPAPPAPGGGPPPGPGGGARMGLLGRAGWAGAAGWAGWETGSYLEEKYVQGTRLSEDIGRLVTELAASIGIKSAQIAVENAARSKGQGSSIVYTGKIIREGSPGSPGAPGEIPAAAVATGRTRAERNLNPGNLEFVGQRGASVEEKGRFAKFSTAEEGVRALARQLQLYEKRGLDTISEIINTYAPSTENDAQAYIDVLAKRLGVSATQTLDVDDPKVMEDLIRGISRHESGVDWLSDEQIFKGMRMAGIQPGDTVTNNVSVGYVTVHTKATDAAGIAKDFNRALIRQADGGLR